MLGLGLEHFLLWNKNMAYYKKYKKSKIATFSTFGNRYYSNNRVSISCIINCLVDALHSDHHSLVDSLHSEIKCHKLQNESVLHYPILYY